MRAHKNLFALISLLVLMVLFPVACSRRMITGKVVDQEGAPVAGAPVGIAGSSHETKTDSSGNYELPWVEGNVMIVTLPPPNKREQYEEPKSPSLWSPEPKHIISVFLAADRYPDGYKASNLVLVDIPKRIAAEERRKAAEVAAKAKQEAEERQRRELERQSREREIASVFEVHPEVVIHRKTGLMWHRSFTEPKDYISAMHYCDQLNSAGYTDWRLPSKQELENLRLILSRFSFAKGDCRTPPFVWPQGSGAVFWSCTTQIETNFKLFWWLSCKVQLVGFSREAVPRWREDGVPIRGQDTGRFLVRAIRNVNVTKTQLTTLSSMKEAIVGSWTWHNGYVSASYSSDGTFRMGQNSVVKQGTWKIIESNHTRILTVTLTAEGVLGNPNWWDISPEETEWEIQEFTQNRLVVKSKDKKEVVDIGLRIE